MRHAPPLQSRENTPIWEWWTDYLPQRPLATSNFAEGAWRQSKSAALAETYLEFNSANLVGWLVLDIDDGDAFESWERAKLPAPNAFVQNGSNGNGHLFYALLTAVSTGALSREKPLRFAADVQRGMTVCLKADQAFTNRIAKNPVSPRWRASWMAPFPYTLFELRGWLDDKDVWRPKEPCHALGLGRNCDLFDITRAYAYKAVRRFKAGGRGLDRWTEELNKVATAHNLEFIPPLPTSEVRSIARSVAKWTWLRFTGDGFSAKQAARGRRGAEIRWEGHESNDYRRPWEAEGVSRATWYRRQSGLLVPGDPIDHLGED
jgi:Replicase family/Primase C terminal 1 (PriCT-1)